MYRTISECKKREATPETPSKEGQSRRKRVRFEPIVEEAKEEKPTQEEEKEEEPTLEDVKEEEHMEASQTVERPAASRTKTQPKKLRSAIKPDPKKANPAKEPQPMKRELTVADFEQDPPAPPGSDTEEEADFRSLSRSKSELGMTPQSLRRY